MRIFVGVDQRQPLAYTVLQSSIIRRASKPVSITPLLIDQLPIKRRGLTDFSFSRYLVPYLCDYQGWALFLDADMLALCDVFEFEAFQDESMAVQVVQLPERFEWPALMLFNCAKCTELTPEFVDKGDPERLMWGDVGDLPPDYHHLVGYHAPNPTARIVHFTMGIPEFPEVRPCEYMKEWMQEKHVALMNCSWLELMGKSVHAERVLEKFV